MDSSSRNALALPFFALERAGCGAGAGASSLGTNEGAEGKIGITAGRGVETPAREGYNEVAPLAAGGGAGATTRGRRDVLGPVSA